MKSMLIEVGKNGRRGFWLLSSAVLASVFVSGSVLAAEAASPAADVPATASADESAVAPPSAAHHGSVFVDPLGFLLFGPTFGVEAGAGRITGTLYGRWLSGGVLAHSLFLKDNDSFAFSYGAGLRGRYFFRDGLSGPHVGIGAELVQTRVDDSSNLVETKSTYVVPLVEGGYRLPLSGAYLGAAASLGYAFQASSSVANLPGGSSAGAFSASDKSTIYASASLEMGVYF
ncbi:MAG: hypothetical protein ABI627_15530 [Polyangiaceae bacterium]